MKKSPSPSNWLSLILLAIAVSALSASIKVSVDRVANAAFLPVAFFALALSSLLGNSRLPARRAWGILVIGGLLFIFIETAKLHEVIFAAIKSLPRFEIDAVQSLLKKEWPDTSILQIQFVELAKRSSTFFKILFKGNHENPLLREAIWDLPVLLLSAWAGWQMSRNKSPLLALLPSIILQGVILDYTGRSALSLQIAVFAWVALMGLNHLSHQTSREISKAQWETFSAVMVISFGLGIAAGLMPVISMREIAQKIGENEVGKMLGLQPKPRKVYSASSSGLPREHLIGSTPAELQTIVFTARTNDAILSNRKEDAPRHYWRWLIFDQYNGRGWFTSSATKREYPENEAVFEFSNTAYKVIHQEIRKRIEGDYHLYWTGSLLRTSVPYEAGWRISPASLPPEANPLLASDMLGALTESDFYYADSIVPLTSKEQLRNAPQTYPAEIAGRYLLLPESVTERTRELANELTKGLDNPYDKARAIEAYLRTYPYSLNVRPPSSAQDIADYFLFDLKTGYCDYYATAMIVMARSVGIPSRLVIGYASGDYNARDETYTVREKHAHSWVEVYFPEIGWVEFEPTASLPLINLPATNPLEPITVGAPSAANLRGHPAYIKQGFFRQSAFQLPILPSLGIAFILLAFWFLRSQGLLRAFPTVGSIYEFVYQHGGRIYKEARVNDTPSMFAKGLKERLKTGYTWLMPAYAELDYLTDLYLQETYSAHPVTPDERRQAVRVWRRLFWRLLYARVMRV